MSDLFGSAPPPPPPMREAEQVASSASGNHHQESLSTPAPSSRPQGTRLFSPRSTAAIALSSILTQPSQGSDAENNHPNDANESEAAETPREEQPEKTTSNQPQSFGGEKEPEQSSGSNQGDFQLHVPYGPPPHHANFSQGNPHHQLQHHPQGPPPPGMSGPGGGPHFPPPYYQQHYQGPPPQMHYSHPPMSQGYHQPPKKITNGPMPPMEYSMPPPPPPPHGQYGQGPPSYGGPQGNSWWDPNPPPPPPPGGYYMPPQQGRGPAPSYPSYGPPPYGHSQMQPYPPPPYPMMHPSKPFHERSWTSSPDNYDSKRIKTSREQGTYNRKLKSLGVLAEAFVSKHKDVPTNTSIVVDDMARMLSVERRRIYDVINILESVKIVVKKSKNTYVWMGLDVMTMALGELQDEAISRYPDDALKFGLITQEECDKCKNVALPDESIHHKTLNRLTQQYLHVYLVGHQTLSLPEASDRIHGSTSTMVELAKLGGWDGSEDGTGMAMHKAASKGLKTKIRRLYDVSNVLYHMNWIVKLAPAIHQPSMDSDIAPLLLERRPQYKWNYLSPKEIRSAYLKAKEASGNKAPTMLQPVGARPSETTATPASVAIGPSAAGRRVSMSQSEERPVMSLSRPPFGDVSGPSQGNPVL